MVFHTDFYYVINDRYIYRVCCMGLGARLVVTFSGGGALCVEVPVTLVRVYLGMVNCFGTRLCWGGGGGNVTFPGIGLSRGIPLSLILVCTSGPQRSGMFRWSWCRVLYNWRERWTRPLEHASPIAQFMQ